MSTYNRRTPDRPGEPNRGRGTNVRSSDSVNKVPNKAFTKWSGSPARYKTIGQNVLDTILTGHLTQEQAEAYQQYFRIEEISDLLRSAHQQKTDVTSLLPSGNLKDNPQFQRDPSPPPKYDNQGNRVNTREARTKIFLEKERHYLVETAAGAIKNYVAPLDYRKPTKTYEKIYIPVKDYPDINFVGLLLGPRGNTLRQLQENSGARLAIRGKGSVKDGKSTSTNNDDDDSNTALSSSSFANPNLNSNADDLHVVITSDSQAKIAKAIKLTNEVIEKAISSPFGQNDLKRGQLRELAVLNGTLRETKPYVPESERERRPNNRPVIDVSSIVCQNCGKVGHFARDCIMTPNDKNVAVHSQGTLKNNNDNNTYIPNKGSYSQPGQNDATKRTFSSNEPSEESIPPWKKQKPQIHLPPWQKAQTRTNSNLTPPPPGMPSLPTIPSKLPPPPPGIQIKPPPPPAMQAKPPPPGIQFKPPPPGMQSKPPPPPAPSS